MKKDKTEVTFKQFEEAVEVIRRFKKKYNDELALIKTQRMGRNKKILKLRKQGLSLRKISEQFGITKQAVHQILNKFE